VIDDDDVAMGEDEKDAEISVRQSYATKFEFKIMQAGDHAASGYQPMTLSIEAVPMSES
jgi:hypothetical protein